MSTSIYYSIKIWHSPSLRHSLWSFLSEDFFKFHFLHKFVFAINLRSLNLLQKKNNKSAKKLYSILKSLRLQTKLAPLLYLTTKLFNHKMRPLWMDWTPKTVIPVKVRPTPHETDLPSKAVLSEKKIAPGSHFIRKSSPALVK